MNDCTSAAGILAETGADPILLVLLTAVAVTLIGAGTLLVLRRRGRAAGAAAVLAVLLAGGVFASAPSPASAAASCPAAGAPAPPVVAPPAVDPVVVTRLDVFGATTDAWAGTHDRVPDTVGLYDPDQERGTDQIPLETALARCDTDYVPGPVPMWLVLVSSDSRVVAWRMPIRSADAEPQQFSGIPLGSFDVYVIGEDRAVGSVFPDDANIGVNSARTWSLTGCDVEWEGTTLTEGQFTTGIAGWLSAQVGDGGGSRTEVTAAHPVVEVLLRSNLP